MVFQRETSADIFSIFPTRKFRFIIDPRSIQDFATDKYQRVLWLIADLAQTDCPVWIELVAPAYLTDEATRHTAARIAPSLYWVADAEGISDFTLDDAFPEPYRTPLTGSDELGCSARGLMSFSDAIQADGIITNLSHLCDARWNLKTPYRIRVIPLAEFQDIVEIIAHGHAIFWSASNPERRLTVDMFYQSTHWKNARLVNWLSRVENQIASEDGRQTLRNAILNRLPYILYARDMIHFYDLQLDYYSRRGLLLRFATALTYHLNTFYLLLWGMLDQLTVITKHVRNLQIAERACGIKSRNFWNALAPTASGLVQFVNNPPIAQWIDQMADLRHTAAHRTIVMPGPLFEETGESEKPEQEVIAEIRKKCQILYEFAPEQMAAQEAMMVRMWRIGKMKQLLTTLVLVKGRNRSYMIDPVLNLDYDLNHILAVMDAFFIALFGGQ